MHLSLVAKQRNPIWICALLTIQIRFSRDFKNASFYFQMSQDQPSMPKNTKQKYKTYSNENKICIHQLHSDSVRLRTDLDYFRDEKDTNCVGQLEQRLWAEVGLMSKQQSGKLTMHSLARGPEAHFL